ncbi:MAG: bifunctional folylpolyglutamate synthase/dihydrofolate synthase [Gaiellaceae bacterium]|jgi:dihydrofolate synthase/folylpolyglutamate synthase
MTATEWVASLSPWPEEFGLGRMHALLAALDNPQRAYRSVHVVGTNGKSTATRTIAALLRASGLAVGAYTSPHVSGWHERLDTDPEAFERAVARVRAPAEVVGATQFETLTAAAFADFAERKVDAAVVEAGLGGRLDATNVLDAPVVLLTNVGLEHTDVLGDTREKIAAEKLAVAGPRATVVLPDDEWRALVPGRRIVVGGAREAASAFVGHAVDGDVEVSLPGRLERRGPDEVRDGAHTAEAVDWLLARLEPRPWTIVASILRDKDVDAMLSRLAAAGPRLIATRSSNARALDESGLAARAEPYFDHVEAVPDPADALAKAREYGPVLVTGSLYLLADLHDSR